MAKKILFISVFFFSILGLKSQTLDVGFFAGSSYYLGDINPGKHFDQSLFAGGAVARYNKDDRWSFRLNILLGGVQASDKLRKAVENRNLVFTSNITELSGIIEFNFFPYELGNRKYKYTPYIFGGVGLFFFNPKVGEYELRSYQTENQSYKLNGLSIPFGIGFKYSLTEKIGFSIEWGMRKTFTDYIDDVSTVYPDFSLMTPEERAFSDPTGTHSEGEQRGNSETKDWYNFYGITLTYKLNIGSTKCNNF